MNRLVIKNMNNEHFARTIPHKPISASDFVDLMLGEKIGEGMSRDVYEFSINTDYVVKHETGDAYQNVIEWTIWQAIKDTPMKKWFAPCHFISPNGLFLIQERAIPCPKEMYPKRVPACMSDFKYKNFGLIKGKFVCIDYGTMPITNYAITPKMKKADWWE